MRAGRDVPPGPMRWGRPGRQPACGHDVLDGMPRRHRLLRVQPLRLRRLDRRQEALRSGCRPSREALISPCSQLDCRCRPPRRVEASAGHSRTVTKARSRLVFAFARCMNHAPLEGWFAREINFKVGTGASCILHCKVAKSVSLGGADLVFSPSRAGAKSSATPADIDSSPPTML